MLALSTAAALLFAARLLIVAMNWSGTPPVQPIEGWMTPGFVAHSNHVPPAVVRDALGLKPGGRRRTLGQIAAERGQSLEAMGAQIEAAIAASRAAPE